MKNRNKGYIQLSLAMFFAGSTVVAGKYMLEMPIGISQTISLLLGLIAILPFALIMEGPLKDFKMSKKDWILIFMQGFSGIFIFRLNVLLGLRYTSAIQSGIIMSFTPGFLGLFSLIILKERLSKRIITGIIISVVAIAILNTVGEQKNISFIRDNFIGNGFILIAVVGEVLFTIFRKLQTKENKPITTTFFVILFAFICFLPIGIYNSFYYSFEKIKFQDLIPLFYYGVFCSAIGYVCWFSGIKKIKVSIATVFTGIMPISSVSLSLILLKETLFIQHVLGIILALSGIFLATSSHKENNESQSNKLNCI